MNTIELLTCFVPYFCIMIFYFITDYRIDKINDKIEKLNKLIQKETDEEKLIMNDYVKAIIKIKVPKWQIGKEVSVYFPDTMRVKATVERSDDDDRSIES